MHTTQRQPIIPKSDRLAICASPRPQKTEDRHDYSRETPQVRAAAMPGVPEHPNDQV